MNNSKLNSTKNCYFCPKGEPQTFDLKFKRAEDYPIDLYYLMDLSFSMKDDLENVKNLGTDLMAEMQKITSDFKIGKQNTAPNEMIIIIIRRRRNKTAFF